jgi:CheY-like chemotaxis protein
VKCLVIDSDAEIRRLIAAVLAPMSVEIVECADAARAPEIYRTHWPDVVLAELAVDGGDALRTARAILAIDPVARIVIVTNVDGADLRRAAKAAGAADYVLKENLLELLPLLESLRG